MSNSHPLKRELPEHFGKSKTPISEQELWRKEVSDAFACPNCKAPKGFRCTRKNGTFTLRCHSERSRKFVRFLQRNIP